MALTNAQSSLSQKSCALYCLLSEKSLSHFVVPFPVVYFSLSSASSSHAFQSPEWLNSSRRVGIYDCSDLIHM